MTSCKLVFKIFGIENLIHLKSFKERHVPFFMNTLMNCKIAFNVIKNYCSFLSQELLKEIISLPIYRVRKNVNEKVVKKADFVCGEINFFPTSNYSCSVQKSL